MRSNRFLFLGLYLLGVMLMVALFLTFVPPAYRTPVVWMDLFIVWFIYTGIWGKYSLLYPVMGRFAEGVPTLVYYWWSFGTYAAIAVAAMPVLGLLGVSFTVQALLQACLLFGLIVCLGAGLGASNFLASESGRIRQEVGGVRDIQFRASQARIALAGLPPAYAFVAGEFEKVADAVTCMGGCNNPQARSAEAQIAGLLDQFLAECAAQAPEAKCLATIRALTAAVALRKTITNI